MRGRHSRDGIAQSGVSANTRVDTLRGQVAARDLQIGDQVKTFDGTFAELRWVGTSRPSMGQDMPMRRTNDDGSESTTLLTPEHLVLVKNPKIALMFGVDDALCPAKFLSKSGAYVPDPTVNPVFVHLLFDTCELVKCGTDWVESLSPNMAQIRSEDLDTAKEIVKHLPRLANHQGHSSYIQDRLVLNEREAELLFQ